MRALSRVALSVATAAIAGGIVLAPSASATTGTGASADTAAATVAAATAPRDCPASYACVYPQVGYHGHVVLLHDNNRHITGGALEHPKSAYNHGSHCVVFYTAPARFGAKYPLNPGTGWSRIGSNLPHIHSNQWTTPRC